MPKRKTIICNIGKNIIFGMTNVQEVFGHDDSLPFNADISIMNPEWDLPNLTEVGRAWNDGWGGDTIIEFLQHRNIEKKLDTYIREHYQMTFGEISWDFNLEQLVSSLACLAIDGGVKNLNIEQISGCKVK